jgi:hypothetical protein
LVVVLCLGVQWLRDGRAKCLTWVDWRVVDGWVVGCSWRWVGWLVDRLVLLAGAAWGWVPVVSHFRRFIFMHDRSPPHAAGKSSEAHVANTCWSFLFIACFRKIFRFDLISLRAVVRPCSAGGLVFDGLFFLVFCSGLFDYPSVCCVWHSVENDVFRGAAAALRSVFGLWCLFLFACVLLVLPLFFSFLLSIHAIS